MLTGSTALIAENERLKALLRKASKAMYCCTIIGFGKEHDPASDFCKGTLYAIEAVNGNIWETLGAPDGKRSYMWWERQIDPTAKFVDGEGNEIQHPAKDEKQ